MLRLLRFSICAEYCNSVPMDHVTRQYQTLMDLARQEQQDAALKRQLQGWSGLSLDQQIRLYETNPKTAAIK